MSKIHEVTPTAARALILNGALLVDVREPNEVARKSFDVPDMLQIPLYELEKRFREIPQNREVIIACHSGNRSMMALHLLERHGFRKAVNLQYGITGWSREGLPIKKMEKVNPLSGLLQMFHKN
ncbi:MAG: rhodanese-like domain-containing protein [Chlorobiaceae bacterium]|nr:rhodanese-like domain-containing protein [Chlorobiaceae bacterium]